MAALSLEEKVMASRRPLFRDPKSEKRVTDFYNRDVKGEQGSAAAESLFTAEQRQQQNADNKDEMPFAGSAATLGLGLGPRPEDANAMNTTRKQFLQDQGAADDPNMSAAARNLIGQRAAGMLPVPNWGM